MAGLPFAAAALRLDAIDFHPVGSTVFSPLRPRLADALSGEAAADYFLLLADDFVHVVSRLRGWLLLLLRCLSDLREHRC
jgi:hypothetical protein